MPEYKHLQIVDKWELLRSHINDEIDDWVKYQRKHPPESEYLGQHKFYQNPEAHDAPLFSLKCKMERLQEREDCEKWWVDAIAEVCRGDVALYILSGLRMGKYTYPVRTDDDHKYTRDEVLEHTVKVRYAEYMYKQAQKGGTA